MRKAACILPVLMLLLQAGGCSLFREVLVSRQDSLQTSSQKASLDWNIDSVHSAGRKFSFTDSSGAQVEVEIAPSGPFTFSAQAGFAGSASLVRIRGKSQTSSRAVDSSSEKMQTRSSGVLKQQVKVKTETTQKQRTKTGNNNLWWVLTLLAACLLVYVVIIFRRKSFY